MVHNNGTNQAAIIKKAVNQFKSFSTTNHQSTTEFKRSKWRKEFIDEASAKYRASQARHKLFTAIERARKAAAEESVEKDTADAAVKAATEEKNAAEAAAKVAEAVATSLREEAAANAGNVGYYAAYKEISEYPDNAKAITFNVIKVASDAAYDAAFEAFKQNPANKQKAKYNAAVAAFSTFVQASRKAKMPVVTETINIENIVSKKINNRGNNKIKNTFATCPPCPPCSIQSPYLSPPAAGGYMTNKYQYGTRKHHHKRRYKRSTHRK
jgi:hypothetical protein